MPPELLPVEELVLVELEVLVELDVLDVMLPEVELLVDVLVDTLPEVELLVETLPDDDDVLVTLPELVDVELPPVEVEVTRANGESFTFTAKCRIDTANEMEYYRNGGILHYVLRKLAA